MDFKISGLRLGLGHEERELGLGLAPIGLHLWSSIMKTISITTHNNTNTV